VAKPQKQAALAPPQTDQQRKGVELQAAPTAAPPTPTTQFAAPTPSMPATPAAPATPSAPANPAYVPPEPDISVKYNVMLGLPPDTSGGGGFDAVASDKAEVASEVVAAFRRHLRTCSKLPPSIAPSDAVRIKLRVLMTPDGKIAAEPAVVEGSASIKALDLKQSAVDALQACQPYTMLPADRYREWKVLDLNFTPADFSS
jgi:outer membrane biosynthesis protein TonB